MALFTSAQHFVLFLCIVMITACNSAKKENPVLKEAAQTHAQALEIEKLVAPQLEELTQWKNGINVQGRALTPEEVELVQAIESIVQRYEYWEENHVEVPGYEHDHEGHEHHDHGAALELTAEDMLVVQREFRDSIVAIQQYVDATLQKVNQTKQ